MLASLWFLICIIYYHKIGHDYDIERNEGEEDEDMRKTWSFRIWYNIDKKTRWIVDRIRVPTSSMKLSPLMTSLFLFLAVLSATPFLIVRLFQQTGEKPSQSQVRLILWSIELRFAGDLLIPIMLLYLMVFLFSDLSQNAGTHLFQAVKNRDMVPIVLIAISYIVDTASFFEQPNEFKVKTRASTANGDEGGQGWFLRQVFVCVAVVFLFVLAIIQKRRCLKLSDEKKSKHLFNNVAFVAMSTWPTTAYLVR